MAETPTTTITVTEDAKATIDANRPTRYESYSSFLTDLMKFLPSSQRLSDGCAYHECSAGIRDTFERGSGVIAWSATKLETDTFKTTSFYCSAECAHAAEQYAASHVPETADAVYIGGEYTAVSHATNVGFYLDGMTKELSFTIPNAFSATDGDDYVYEGEPVWVENDGTIIHSGRITDLMWDEGRTALIFEEDYDLPEEPPTT